MTTATATEIAPVDAAMDKYGVVLIITDRDSEDDYATALEGFMAQTEDTRDVAFVANYRKFGDESWIWTLGTKKLHHNQLARLGRLHTASGF